MDSRTAFLSAAGVRETTAPRMAAQALLTAAGLALAKATPPTSDLWMTRGETILTTISPPPRAPSSRRPAAFPTGMKTWRGVGMPASFRTS